MKDKIKECLDKAVVTINTGLSVSQTLFVSTDKISSALATELEKEHVKKSRVREMLDSIEDNIKDDNFAIVSGLLIPQYKRELAEGE